MAISQNQTKITLTYNDYIKNLISISGGTVVFMKDNMIVASEISEEQYRSLLKNPYIEKIDIIPMKRYDYTQTILTGNTFKTSDTTTSIS